MANKQAIYASHSLPINSIPSSFAKPEIPQELFSRLAFFRPPSAIAFQFFNGR